MSGAGSLLYKYEMPEIYCPLGQFLSFYKRNLRSESFVDALALRDRLSQSTIGDFSAFRKNEASANFL
jgi:hypothetical protein